jgi:hypothetical protein
MFTTLMHWEIDFIEQCSLSIFYSLELCYVENYYSTECLRTLLSRPLTIPHVIMIIAGMKRS